MQRVAAVWQASPRMSHWSRRAGGEGLAVGCLREGPSGREKSSAKALRQDSACRYEERVTHVVGAAAVQVLE